ncbi:hypothetical protein FG877_02180 [Enterococcus casseliflavus]|nr:hypothetical protein [Enterococcus casseliflavus]
MKNKKKIGIISAVLIIVLIAGGAIFYKIQQDKLTNNINKLKGNQVIQEEILSELKTSWDEEDNNYVSADLTKDTLEILDKKISSQTAELQNFKGNNDKKIASLYSEQSKISEDIKVEQHKLTEAFDYTNSINNSFEEKVIIGSKVKNNGHVKLNTDLSDLENQLNDSKILNTSLKETINNLIIIGNEQIKENTELQTRIKEISNDGKLKEDVTIEDLNSFNDYVSKLKYPFLKDEHKKIIDEIPSKIESLSPKVSNLSDKELQKRILALEFKTNDYNTFSIFAKNENKQTVSIYTLIPRGYGVLSSVINSYSIEENGDYKIEGQQEKTGNIFKDITDEEVSNIRDNPDKVAIPPLSIEEFKEALNEKFENILNVESSSDMVLRFPSGPSMLLKYNSVNGSVETKKEGPFIVNDEYKYNQEYTQLIWDYWTSKGY